jgi:hypothetical protein
VKFYVAVLKWCYEDGVQKAYQEVSRSEKVGYVISHKLSLQLYK